MYDVIEPKVRFRSQKICSKQETRDMNAFDNFIIYYPIGDRCKAKSFFRERFFGSFSSLKIE